jgi:uncharacterized delta-60 repeat protein
MRHLSSSACVQSLEARQLFHAIYVDPTFGADGALAIQTQALAEQPNGKLVAVLKESGSGDSSDLALMGLTGEGTPDKTFGHGGLVHTDVLRGEDKFEALAADSHGMIYVLSTSYAPGSQTPRKIIIRYLSHGRVDKTFGTSGQLEISNLFPNFVAQTITTDHSDRLVVCGKIVDGQGKLQTNVAVVRFVHDAPDPHWGANGIAATVLKDTATPTKVMSTFDNGMTVAAQEPAHSNDITLLRYTSRGRLDKTYGMGGASIHTFAPDAYGGPGPSLSDMASYHDGSVIYCGTYGIGYHFMMRTKADGTLDTAFGTNGFIQNTEAAYFNIGTDGLILTSNAGGAETKALRLYDSTGKLIDDFGDRGMLIGYAGRMIRSQSALLIQYSNMI